MTSPPTALRIHEVPIDLKCPICFDVPLRPNITPCQHLFCDVCLEQALLVNKACPICRFDCTSNQMRSLEPGTLIHRVWSSIEVKCTNHQGSCQWTGSIGDYGNHLEQCGQCFHARLANMVSEIRILRRQNAELQKRLKMQIQWQKVIKFVMEGAHWSLMLLGPLLMKCGQWSFMLLITFLKKGSSWIFLHFIAITNFILCVLSFVIFLFLIYLCAVFVLDWIIHILLNFISVQCIK